MSEQILVERNGRLFEIDVTYFKGKGYYAYAYPAEKTVTGGTAISIFDGVNVFLIKSERKSAKKELEAIELAKDYYELLIEQLLKRPDPFAKG